MEIITLVNKVNSPCSLNKPVRGAGDGVRRVDVG